MSRYLGLDVGDERIGLAISDEGGHLAQPLEVMERLKGNSSFLRIRHIVEAYRVEYLVVGWPLLADGGEGKQTRSVSAYVRGLKEYCELPVILWDERSSTREADEIMHGNELGKRSQQKRRDAVAAAVILQQYLNQLAEETRE